MPTRDDIHIQITAQAVAHAIAIERERCAMLVEEYICSTGHLSELLDMIRNPEPVMNVPGTNEGRT